MNISYSLLHYKVVGPLENKKNNSNVVGLMVGLISLLVSPNYVLKKAMKNKTKNINTNSLTLRFLEM